MNFDSINTRKARVGVITLSLTSNSKEMTSQDYYDLFEVVETFYLENDEISIPWDASISVEDNKLVLSGYAGCSGYGECVTKLPLRDNRAISIVITSSDIDRATELCRKYNWV